MTSVRKADVLSALDQGAVGFIPADVGREDLAEAIRLIAGGGVYVPPSVMRADGGRQEPGPALFDAGWDGQWHDAPRRSASSERSPASFGLTPRQTDVLFLLLQGQTNKQIARELKLSVETVKEHVAAVLRTLNVNSRAQAVLAVNPLHSGIWDWRARHVDVGHSGKLAPSVGGRVGDARVSVRRRSREGRRLQPGPALLRSATAWRRVAVTVLAIGCISIPTAVAALEDVESPELRIAALRRDAVAYEHGNGQPKDGVRAAALYCQAAKLGDAASQFDLGWMYANGRGVQRDDALAAFFFQSAAAQGLRQADAMLKRVGEPAVEIPECMRDPVVVPDSPRDVGRGRTARSADRGAAADPRCWSASWRRNTRYRPGWCSPSSKPNRTSTSLRCRRRTHRG